MRMASFYHECYKKNEFITGVQVLKKLTDGDLNICIECDENGHAGYDHDKEIERIHYCNTHLNNPLWIRF